MEYNYMSFLTDFCFMSLLLVIAQFMRAKIKFLQMFYIPASLVAGILGLLLGPQFLDLIPWSGQIGSYAYMLVCVLFGGLFLGKKEKTSVKKIFTQVGDSFCVNMGAEFFCFGIALLVGGALVTFLFPDVFTEIALLMPSGYCGGHGYASTIGTALNNLLGRTDGVVIGQTFATMACSPACLWVLSASTTPPGKGPPGWSKAPRPCLRTAAPALFLRRSASPWARRPSTPCPWTPWPGIWP